MSQKTIKLAGHKYEVWVDSDGKITHTACWGRWGKCDIALLDEWTKNQLQSLCKGGNFTVGTRRTSKIAKNA